MTEVSFEEIEQAVDEFSNNGRYTEDSLPGSLAGTQLVDPSEELPTRCIRENCRMGCSVIERSGGEVRMECNDPDFPHSFTVDSSDYTYYDLNFEEVLQSVSDTLSEEIVSVETDLPRRITAYTEEELRIVVPLAPARFEREILEIFTEALRDDQATLLITTNDNLDDLLDLASLFTTGCLVYVAPFSELDDTADHLVTMTETARSIQRMEEEFVASRYDEPEDLVHKVNMNPRYILTELNHMRLLRKTGQLSGGSRLETVTELVFSHLFSTYPEEGGESSSGQDLPDNIFYIPALEAGDRGNSILGVVDAKSADRARFGREEARGKHDEYIARAERESIQSDRISHTFVILEFKGKQEIEFFDKMDEFYDEDTYLTIITADALALLMAAYLAATVSNELELIYGDFRSAIYPLFDPDTFRELGLGTVVREVGQLQEEYHDDYLQRPDLLIVTRGVVECQLRRCLESEKEIEPLLERYFADVPDI